MKYKGQIYHMYEHLRHLLGNQQEFTKCFLGFHDDCEVSCHDYRILPWEQPSLVTLTHVRLKSEKRNKHDGILGESVKELGDL